MTELRRRLIADLQLRNYSPRTVEAYVDHVAAFARRFGRAPDSLGPDEVKAYQQHLAQERRVAWSTFNQAMAGLRFFCRVTLGREENLPHLFFAKQPRRLPNVLTRADVAALLDAVNSPTPRIVLRTLYSAGLSTTQRYLHVTESRVRGLPSP